jgi:threonine dehydrogenase-like Zn-dependent dehydrogenase
MQAERTAELALGGADVGVDAFGSQAAIDTGFESVTVGGSVAIGVQFAGEMMFAVAQLMCKRVDIHPSVGTPNASAHLIPPMIMSGRLPLFSVVAAYVSPADSVSACATSRLARRVLAISMFSHAQAAFISRATVGRTSIQR